MLYTSTNAQILTLTRFTSTNLHTDTNAYARLAGHVTTLVRYGILCQDSNDGGASMGHLLHALALQPSHAGALAGVGFLHHRRANVSGAQHYYIRSSVCLLY